MDQYSFEVQFLKEKIPCFYITEEKTAVLALKKLQSKDVLFGVDTETMALPQYKHISKAALSPHLSVVRLLQVFDGKSSVIFDIWKIKNWMIFEEFLSTKRFIAHNAIFDLQYFMLNFGIKNMNIGCTLILSKLLFHATYPDDSGLSASLANLVQQVFKIELGKENQASDWSVEDLIAEQIEYAALDAVYVLRLAEKLVAGLTKFKLEKSYKLLKRAQHPIASLQLNGISLDIEKHKKAIGIWRDKLYASKKELLALTGLEKITSHTIADYLLNTLPEEVLSLWPVTETGKLSTDSHTFSEFSYLPVVAPFSEFQKREKLTSSFGSRLISEINPASGRLHSRYNLTGARTGRLSCSQPNLQQIPHSPSKKYLALHPDEPDLRSHFIAGRGRIFVCADYNQIELRIAATLSGDPKMLAAYRDGIDLHALTASKLTGKALKDVTDEERQHGKALNFGLLFGLSHKKYAHYAKKSYGVELTQAEATEAVKGWHDFYEVYTDYQQEVVRKARESLSVRTTFGKLRRLSSDNFYGASLNHDVQGSAAEVMLHALSNFFEYWSPSSSYRTEINNCVHDEILVSCDIGDELVLSTSLEKSMVQGFLDVFPKGITRGLVKVKTGLNWAEAK